jgi:hypothetical protein
MESQADPMGVSYAITDEYFLLSVGASTTTLEAVLIAMQRPSDTPVWESKDVRSTIAALPGGATGIGYQDLAEAGSSVFEMLSLMSTMSDEMAMCDPAEMPQPEVLAKYLGPMSTGVYKDSNSLILRARLLPSRAVSE